MPNVVFDPRWREMDDSDGTAWFKWRTLNSAGFHGEWAYERLSVKTDEKSFYRDMGPEVEEALADHGHFFRGIEFHKIHSPPVSWLDKEIAGIQHRIAGAYADRDALTRWRIEARLWEETKGEKE